MIGIKRASCALQQSVVVNQKLLPCEVWLENYDDNGNETCTPSVENTMVVIVDWLSYT